VPVDSTPCATARIATDYQRLLASDDPAARDLAREQLRRLAGATAHRRVDPAQNSVQDDRLLSAIAAVVGPLTERSNGTHVGPCPWHGSKSGSCLVVWPQEGRWWCSSCRRGGDITLWTALIDGTSLAASGRKLGIPNPPTAPAERRRPNGRTLPANWRPSGRRLRADWRPGLPLFDDEARP
jgi:hypothetical protein